jgi:hypothetical protein
MYSISHESFGSAALTYPDATTEITIRSEYIPGQRVMQMILIRDLDQWSRRKSTKPGYIQGRELAPRVTEILGMSAPGDANMAAPDGQILDTHKFWKGQILDTHELFSGCPEFARI